MGPAIDPEDLGSSLVAELDGLVDQQASDPLAGRLPGAEQEDDVQLGYRRGGRVGRSGSDDQDTDRDVVALGDVEPAADPEPVDALADARPLGEGRRSPLSGLAALDEPRHRVIE